MNKEIFLIKTLYVIENLLLNKREINKLVGLTKQKGYSFNSYELYILKVNLVKLELGIGKGKKLYDKREDIC